MTELELIMDRAETGLAQTLKASTWTPGRSLSLLLKQQLRYSQHSTLPPWSGPLWKELLNTTFRLVFKGYILTKYCQLHSFSLHAWWCSPSSFWNKYVARVHIVICTTSRAFSPLRLLKRNFYTFVTRGLSHINLMTSWPCEISRWQLWTDEVKAVGGWWMTDWSTYSMSGLTDVYLIKLFWCQAEVHLSLCDRDITAHDGSVYSGGMGGGRRDVYIKGCVTLRT